MRFPGSQRPSLFPFAIIAQTDLFCHCPGTTSLARYSPGLRRKRATEPLADAREIGKSWRHKKVLINAIRSLQI
jgi:hypothetical protein